MLKTCLTAFGNVFSGILNNWKFFQFFEVFPSVDPTGCNGHFFPRKLPENKFKSCVETFKITFGHFWEFNFFSIYSSKFYKFRSPGCTGQEKFENLPQASLDTFDNVFPDFDFLKSFRFLWIFLSLQCSLGRAFFRRNNQAKHAQTMFLGTFLENFESFEVFPLFVFFCEFRPPTVHWAKFFAKKNTSKHVENMFEHFWERFYAFWKIESFSSFLKFFQKSTLQGALGTFFKGNCLKTSSKLVWRLSSLFWDTFENSIFFRFFLASFTNFDLQVALGKKSSKKLPQASLNTFDNVFRDFEFLKSFRFLWIFLSLQGSLGRAFFRRNNQAKHGQTMFLGTFLEKFESFAVFPLFCIFCEFRPPRVHWAKIFAKKIPRSMLKTCLIAFGNVFSGILNNWKFFQFFEFFPSFDPPGCTEQKISIKSPQILFGHS